MTPKQEIWRTISGFEGSYEVSNFGRVRSLARVQVIRGRWGQLIERKLRGRVLKLKRLSNGYVSIALGATSKTHLVHRLVGAAFIDNPKSLPEINHKDGVRDNNAASNLEWSTSSDNKLHSYSHLDRTQHAWTLPVALVHGSQRLEFPSQLAAAKHLGVDAGSIRSALKRDHLCRGWSVERIAA